MTRDASIIFVCWGNICRSPMGERVARRWLDDAGLTAARVTSAGTSTEELGNPIDRRARRTLEAHGYHADGHRAHQITRAEIDAANLVLAFEPIHVNRMKRIAPDATNIYLVTDFDPAAVPGSGIDDPWYGEQSGFEHTLTQIEAAMPGVIERVKAAVRDEWK